MKQCLTTLATVLLLANCVARSSAQTIPDRTWAQYQYASDHNAVFTKPDWSVAWRSDAEDKINGGISIVGTTLYYESFDHNIYAVDARTGQERWHTTLSNIVMNTPVVADGLVFVGGGIDLGLPPLGLPDPLSGRVGGDSFYALNAATGAIVWKFDTIGQNMPTPVFLTVGGVPEIVFPSGDLNMYALQAKTGALLWKKPTPGADLMASLNLYDNLIYGITGYSFLLYDSTYQKDGPNAARQMFQHTFAIDGNGASRWSQPYGARGCSPTIANGTVFVESWLPESGDNPTTWREKLWAPLGGWVLYSVLIEPSHNEIAALDARTGALKWLRAFKPGTATNEGSHMDAIAGLYAKGRFFDAVPIDKTFVALDAKNGNVLWTVPTPHPVKMSAVEKDGLVYFGDAGGTLYIVRANDGEVEQRVKFPHGFSISPPLIVGNTMFVSNTNSIYAVRLSDLQRGVGPDN